MSTTYAQRQTTAQKKDANTAASVVDSSSQGESLQRKADMANNATQRAEAPRPNNTGMPDNLKAGIESLSGFSMDDVRVHYNSSKPATVQALAYTQGTDIHVAPGQEKHLPHEAWHVAQQMAGRVSPTTNINGMPVNDNAGLEHEADVMGEKAVAQMVCSNDNKIKSHINEAVCQCVFRKAEKIKNKLDIYKDTRIVGKRKDIEEMCDQFIAGISAVAPSEKHPWRLDNQNSGGNYRVQLNCVKGKKAKKNEQKYGLQAGSSGNSTIAAVMCKNSGADEFRQALSDSKEDGHVYKDTP